MHGKFPQILKDEKIGVEATKLYNDANALLKKVIAEKWLTAKGVIGFWKANSDGKDTIEVSRESGVGSQESGVKSRESGVIHLESLRQQVKKAPGQPNISLTDFIKPKNSKTSSADETDYIGAFAVTIHGIEPHLKKFTENHDDYNKITLQALADRLAEAFAELLHARVRKEFWGYAKDEHLGNEDLIEEKYQGIRPAPGYPACPDHTEKIKLFELLDATKQAGIQLTESLAMYPAASVCGWYFSHPESQYFGVGKIKKDQVEDYANRKKMPFEEIERWLRPVLEYK